MCVWEVKLTVVSLAVARASGGRRSERRARGGWEEWRGEEKGRRREPVTAPSSPRTPTPSWGTRGDENITHGVQRRSSVSVRRVIMWCWTHQRLSSMSWQLGSELCILSPSLRTRYSSVTPNCNNQSHVLSDSLRGRERERESPKCSPS